MLYLGDIVLEKLDKDKIRQILGVVECNKGLLCAELMPEVLCKAKKVGNHVFMMCLEDNSNCSFALPFGTGHVCRCPVRLYISKEFDKSL